MEANHFYVVYNIVITVSVFARQDKILGAKMSFYIPKSFQADPPLPTDDEVY